LARSPVRGYAVGFLVAAICGAVGGWPFALISLIALLLIPRGALSVKIVALTAAFGLLWLVVYKATGDRRIFFPFAMQFALQMAFFRRPMILGWGPIIVAFFVVRILQGATLHVLIVEAAVAFAVGLVTLLAARRSPETWFAWLGWAGLGSFLAYLGLAL
jgi:hypothetical protein